MDGWMNFWMIGWMDALIPRIDGQMFRSKERWMNRLDRWMEIWMDDLGSF